MKELGVWEPLEVKAQTIKTAIESATLLLRIDDIVSGMSKRDRSAPGQSRPGGPQQEDGDNVSAPCPAVYVSVCLVIWGMRYAGAPSWGRVQCKACNIILLVALLRSSCLD